MQNGGTNIATFTAYGIAGEAQILGYNLNWNGTHVYDSSSDQACSAVSGSWSAPTFGPGITGTFTSDNDCSSSTLLPLTCGDFVVDNGGTTGNYANNSYDTYTIDAGEGSTVSLEFSEFNTEEDFDFLQMYDGSDVSAPEITTSAGGATIVDNTIWGVPEYHGFNGNGTLTEDSVVSSGRYLTLVFFSDGSVIESGFNAEIVCVTGRATFGEQNTNENFRSMQAINSRPSKG